MRHRSKRALYMDLLDLVAHALIYTEMQNELSSVTDEGNVLDGWEAQHQNLEVMFFADTLVIYQTETAPNNSRFPVIEVSRIIESLLPRAFQRGFLLRGAVSYGEYILDEAQRLLIGECAAVAHELRNPLGVIKATADVVKLKYENKGQPDELFDYIGKEVNRLNNLVNDFLSFAREIKLNKKTSDIVHTIQKAISAFERDCHEKDISISILKIDTIAPIDFDEDKIQQVLYNLLVNATQAIENNGEVTVEISCILQKGKNFAEIKVKDTGKGIEGDLQKIFEPFYTTKSSGSGLGLAITKQIIEKHGGWIDVESVKNKGTTISFYLPISASKS